MKRVFSVPLKIGLALLLFLTVLSGCADSSDVKNTYPLESVINNGNQTSYVYRAANQTVPDTAKEITDNRSPEQVSKEDTERMFIVYPDELYHLQKDPKKPEDTLIEIDNKEFVRQNYSPSFLQGFIAAQILNSVFDLFRDYQYNKHYGSGHDYRGYGDRDHYRPQGSYHTPTAADKKMAPPVTVQNKGSIIRRGNTPSTSNGTSSGSSSEKKAKIIRGNSGDGSSQGDPYYSPYNNKRPSISSPPRTNSNGYGKIKRRSRH
ncbi:DUF4247 domain-containing protein [Aneurinibacillus tyrosinisolvens]|uniref:DUF4247 domain-containing protein n=1 Tax=Aneurinibacillus tyrosinisolvens TaxID=1443435 RepID=UPI00063F563D|nr:DUF4247 domain-containing protein [Aneurinibacillus tyrosinisolvens]